MLMCSQNAIINREEKGANCIEKKKKRLDDFKKESKESSLATSCCSNRSYKKEKMIKPIYFLLNEDTVIFNFVINNNSKM